MKKKSVVILSILGTIIVLYLAMIVSTNSVINDVKNIMYGNVDQSMTEGTAVNRYNHSYIYENAVVEVKITRLFACHNFFDGYVWVKYSYKTIKNDIDIRPSSVCPLSRWKIHRENGKWHVVEILEAP